MSYIFLFSNPNSEARNIIIFELGNYSSVHKCSFSGININDIKTGT